jgi:hypothetical protein
MVEKPKGTPRMWGSAARKPKLAAMAVAMALFGPGVKDPTSEKTRRAQKCVGSIVRSLWANCTLIVWYTIGTLLAFEEGN